MNPKMCGEYTIPAFLRQGCEYQNERKASVLIPTLLQNPSLLYLGYLLAVLLAD